MADEITNQLEAGEELSTESEKTIQALRERREKRKEQAAAAPPDPPARPARQDSPRAADGTLLLEGGTPPAAAPETTVFRAVDDTGGDGTAAREPKTDGNSNTTSSKSGLPWLREKITLIAAGAAALAILLVLVLLLIGVTTWAWDQFFGSDEPEDRPTANQMKDGGAKEKPSSTRDAKEKDKSQAGKDSTKKKPRTRTVMPAILKERE